MWVDFSGVFVDRSDDLRPGRSLAMQVKLTLVLGLAAAWMLAGCDGGDGECELVKQPNGSYTTVCTPTGSSSTTDDGDRTKPGGDQSTSPVEDPATSPDAGLSIPDAGSVQPYPDAGSVLPADQGVTPTGGAFGDRCDQSSPCQSGICAMLSETAGFCSQQCASLGQACSGGPSGSMPYCALQDPNSGGYACVFICRIVYQGQTQESACPTQLTCDPNGQTQEDGTTVHICIP
jgi:hypothetical protein